MTRRSLLSTCVCCVVSLAIWWGIISLACSVARGATSRATATARLVDVLTGTGLGEAGARAIAARLTVAQMSVLTYRVALVTERAAALEQDGRPRVQHTTDGLARDKWHEVWVDGLRMVRFPAEASESGPIQPDTTRVSICYTTVPGREVIVRSGR